MASSSVWPRTSGQVRDLLPKADDRGLVEIYDTIEEAVTAMSETEGGD